MDFSLSDEQSMLQEMAHEFAASEVQPNAAKWDRDSSFPREAIRKAHELGLLTVKIPEEYGGYGMGSFEEVLICEEIGWGDPGFATASGSTMLASYPVITGGTEDQKQRYLSKVANGCIASYCVTEPGAGSDVQSISTHAVRDGDDYVINGSKMWITGAGHADWFFVLAYTDPSAGYKGMSSFIIDADSPGISLGKKEDNMGQRCSDTRSVDFNDVRVPADNLIGGEENNGWMNAMKAFDLSRPTISAHAFLPWHFPPTSSPVISRSNITCSYSKHGLLRVAMCPMTIKSRIMTASSRWSRSLRELRSRFRFFASASASKQSLWPTELSCF